MLTLMSALLLALGLGTPDEDDAAPARRSQRHWIIDSALFVARARLGAVSLVTSVDHGLDGPLLVVDVIGGARSARALVAAALAARPRAGLAADPGRLVGRASA